jgi:hypothetical protein
MKVEWPEVLHTLPQTEKRTDVDGNLVYCGLRVKMAVHYGEPIPHEDPVSGLFYLFFIFILFVTLSF